MLTTGFVPPLQYQLAGLGVTQVGPSGASDPMSCQHSIPEGQGVTASQEMLETVVPGSSRTADFSRAAFPRLLPALTAEEYEIASTDAVNKIETNNRVLLDMIPTP